MICDADIVSIDDENEQSLIPSDDDEADPDFEPDDEQPAPVPSYSQFPIGKTPANGKWGLSKTQQRAAAHAYRKERRALKKRKQQRNRRLRHQGWAQEDNRSLINALPATAMTSGTTTSIGFGLKTLSMNATAPSIATGLADMNLMPKSSYRKRVDGPNEMHGRVLSAPEEISSKPEAVTGSDAAQAEFSRSAGVSSLASYLEIARRQKYLCWAQECLAIVRRNRSAIFQREAGIEPVKVNYRDSGPIVYFNKKAVEGGGFELVKQVWYNGKRIEGESGDYYY